MTSKTYPKNVTPLHQPSVTPQTTQEEEPPEYYTGRSSPSIDHRHFVKWIQRPMNAIYKTPSWYESSEVTGQGVRVGAFLIDNTGYDGYVLVTATEVAERFGIRLTNAAAHMRNLVKAGLITSVKPRIVQNKMVKYRMNPEYISRGRLKPVGL